VKHLATYLAHFHVTGWGWYWIVWAVLGFGLPEAYGLVYNTQDTLSWQFWGIEQVNFRHPFDFADWTPVHWVLALILLSFVVWLGGHIVLGIWR
jgi:hypothetical protein